MLSRCSASPSSAERSSGGPRREFVMRRVCGFSFRVLEPFGARVRRAERRRRPSTASSSRASVRRPAAQPTPPRRGSAAASLEFLLTGAIRRPPPRRRGRRRAAAGREPSRRRADAAGAGRSRGEPADELPAPGGRLCRPRAAGHDRDRHAEQVPVPGAAARPRDPLRRRRRAAGLRMVGRQDGHAARPNGRTGRRRSK